MSPELDYAAIRSRVETRLRKLKIWTQLSLLLIHLALFGGLMFVAWGGYLFMGGRLPTWQDFSYGFSLDSSIDAPLLAMTVLSGGWAVAVVIHIAALLVNTRFSEQPVRDWLMGREVNHEMKRLDLHEGTAEEKAKRLMRLSDDGELQEVVDDEAEAEIKRQHSA